MPTLLTISIFIATVGLIAYETAALEGMVVDEGGVIGQDSSRGNPFPQNAVQEFRVLTQNYSAEYQLLQYVNGQCCNQEVRDTTFGFLQGMSVAQASRRRPVQR